MSKPTKADLEVFYYITETGSLMFMPRTHQRSLINSFDSVASHAYHVAIIAYSIAKLEGLDEKEALKAMAMGLLHDNAEARTGDQDFIQKHYGVVNDEKAINDQLKNLPFEKELNPLIKEYENRETLTSKCTKDADTLDQLYQEWILTNLGNQMAKRWFDGDYKHRVPFLRTNSAKRIAQIMRKSKPHDWWFKDLVDQGIDRKKLNGMK